MKGQSVIWIDITNAPHVHVFKNLIRRLSSNYETLVTARDFGPIFDLLEDEGIDYIPAGKHGGPTREGKLHASIERERELYKIFSERKPTLCVFKHSVEAARVSFGLNIYSMALVDNEHAEAQNRLTIPITQKIIIPSVIPIQNITYYGAKRENITTFDGVCEVAHVKEICSPNVIKKQIPDLDTGKKIITVRPEPVLADYMRENGENSLCTSVIYNLLKDREDIQIVFLPRSEKQKQEAKMLFEGVICPEKVHGPTLLSISSLLIGGGGTMNREAALLGTPSISCYPGELLAVSKYFIEKNLIFQSQDLDEILDKSAEILDSDVEKYRERAKNLFENLEDPVDVLIEEIKRKIGRSEEKISVEMSEAT
ncbi:MAG: DUF354 domain-containing protein [Candidatus Hydrothermarchaeota archaeon]